MMAKVEGKTMREALLKVVQEATDSIEVVRRDMDTYDKYPELGEARLQREGYVYSKAHNGWVHHKLV